MRSSHSDDFIATSLLEVPAAEDEEACKEDHEQSNPHSPEKQSSKFTSNILHQSLNLKMTQKPSFVSSSPIFKLKVLLLSSDISSSTTGEINVEVSTRHPVCVIAQHQAKRQQKADKKNDIPLAKSSRFKESECTTIQVCFVIACTVVHLNTLLPSSLKKKKSNRKLIKTTYP